MNLPGSILQSSQMNLNGASRYSLKLVDPIDMLQCRRREIDKSTDGWPQEF